MPGVPIAERPNPAIALVVALRRRLNQIRSYAPKVPDEARAWAERR